MAEKEYPKQTWKDYKCSGCGHVQSIRTNHFGTCYDYCKSCSWTMGKYDGVMMFGHMYRLFSLAH